MTIRWYDTDHNEVPESVGVTLVGSQVATDQVGDTLVSTIFLSADHRHGGGGPPLLYETMIFGADGDERGADRYPSRVEALAGHALAVAEVSL